MSSARQIAADRFARGEITAEEYKGIISQLEAVERIAPNGDGSSGENSNSHAPSKAEPLTDKQFGISIGAAAAMLAIGLYIFAVRSSALASCQVDPRYTKCIQTSGGAIIAWVLVIAGIGLGILTLLAYIEREQAAAKQG